jgi:hypothetical protein
MTRDDIIRLALDAGLLNYVDNETPRRYFIHGHADLEELERFAALVAAAEREACAGLCDEIEKKKWETVMHGGEMQGISARDCAAAIRERGETNDIA